MVASLVVSAMCLLLGCYVLRRRTFRRTAMVVMASAAFVAPLAALPSSPEAAAAGWFLSPVATVPRDQGPAYRVTAAGQMQYDYEALLHELFVDPIQCGVLTVNVSGVPTTVHNWWFNAAHLPKNQNTSLANCPGYLPLFTHFGRSPWHLEPAWFAIAPSQSGFIFGATNGPVLINGRYVACEPSGTEVLGEGGGAWTGSDSGSTSGYAGGSLALSCFPLNGRA
jgi:hypothetical protein